MKNTTAPLSSSLPSGFPSPAEDYLESSLDFNQLLIRHPAATFYLRARGESMTGVGIFPGDLLIVDRAVKPVHGSVIIAAVGGEFTVKKLEIRGKEPWLVSSHPSYRPLRVETGETFDVWGVVTYVVHGLQPGARP